jgi:hypothetical protein
MEVTRRSSNAAYPPPPKPTEVYSLPLPEIIEVKSTPQFKPAEINLSPVVDEAEVPKAKLLEKVLSYLLIDANEAMQMGSEWSQKPLSFCFLSVLYPTKIPLCNFIFQSAFGKYYRPSLFPHCVTLQP